jgi:cytochrome c biogenesis protein ResB
MSKTIRRVFLVSLLLLLTAIGSCYVGALQSQNEQEQFEKYEEASGFRIYDADIDSENYWQTTGFLLFFASIGVGIAACLLLERDKNAGCY